MKGHYLVVMFFKLSPHMNAPNHVAILAILEVTLKIVVVPSNGINTT